MGCIWTLEGELSRTTYKTSARGRAYWLALVRVEAGEICLYVHDPDLQRKIETAKLGSRVIATGPIEPHKMYSQAEKPYFLSPTVLTISDEP